MIDVYACCGLHCLWKMIVAYFFDSNRGDRVRVIYRNKEKMIRERGSVGLS